VSRNRPSVLFLCTHNAGRSQMAAALLARQAGSDLVIHSAGSEPAETLNPAVVEALSELGIDISAEKPKRLTDEMVAGVDVVITMGCGDACPIYPGKRYLDWDLPDPAGLPIEEVRPIRDRIDELVGRLVADLLPQH
jgi:arsenate reductase